MNIIYNIIGAENSPSGITFNATNNNSATLTWLPPADDLNCSFNYTVNITNSSSVTEQVYSNNTSLILTDLTRGENYSFAVAVTDSTGQHGPWSEELRVDGENSYEHVPVTTEITYPTLTVATDDLIFKQMMTAYTRTTYPAIASATTSTLPKSKIKGYILI